MAILAQTKNGLHIGVFKCLAEPSICCMPHKGIVQCLYLFQPGTLNCKKLHNIRTGVAFSLVQYSTIPPCASVNTCLIPVCPLGCAVHTK